MTLSKRLAAEALGTLLLVATVVGSGIMAETLSEDVGLQLLGNTLPTGAILVVLITILGPVSGAQFNPAVTLALLVRGEMALATAGLFVLAQVGGGILGSVVAHGMFDQALIQASEKVRTGPAQWFSEIVATFGLVFVIFGGLRFRPEAIPWLVGLYITAAYWFTASTSFANPAVAISRGFTNTFSGIQPADVPAFVAAQCVGAVIAALLAAWLFAPEDDERAA